MLSRPTVLPELVVVVVAPDGRDVAHCGTWYKQGESYALVEPVATDPAYRMQGLGRAAVLEAVTRCGRLGATMVFVGSDQLFYSVMNRLVRFMASGSNTPPLGALPICARMARCA